jgi:dienelactone hydrolase
MGSFIEMPDGRGSAYLSIPAAGSGPGVLVLHAWWGLNQTFIDVCDLLSERGFLALAPDRRLKLDPLEGHRDRPTVAQAQRRETGAAGPQLEPTRATPQRG